MKRIFSIIFALFAVFVLCSCGANKNNNVKSGDDEVIKTMKLVVGEKEFDVSLTVNSTTKELVKLFPLELEMTDLNKNEKYYYLDQDLPIIAYAPRTIECGDVMLYGSNCLVIFYKTFETSYLYTRIGKIKDTTGLAKALGSGQATVKWTL